MFIVTVTLVFLSIGVYYLFEDLDKTKDYSASILENQIPLISVPEVESSKLRMTRIEDGYYLELIDGQGSELDADLFDEKDSEYYLNIGNIKSGELKTEFYSAIKDLEDEGYIVNGKFVDSLFTVQNPSSINLTTWSGSSNITKVGRLTNGTWNAEPITTEYIADRTIALADLAQNGCSNGQTIKWNSSLNVWVCADDEQSNLGSISWNDIQNRPAGLDDGDDDTVLTEAQVETYIINGSINLNAASQVGGEQIASRNWVNSQGFLSSYTETDPTLSTWTGSSNISTVGTITSGTWNGTAFTSSNIQDGSLSLSDLGQNGCSAGQVIKWNASPAGWVCAADLEGIASVDWSSILNRPAGLDDGDDDTVLTEGQVESYVTNSAINLATGSQVNSENIATQNWVGSQGYMTSYSESDPSLATWTGSSNISTVGTITNGTWNGNAITTEYIADNTISLSDLAQNGCSDGQVMKWESDVNAWICANDNEGSGSIGVTITPIYEKWDPDAPPLNPSAYDDEFNDEVLDPSWSIISTGVTSEINKYFMFGSGDNYIYKTLPGGDFTIWTKLSLSGYPQLLSHSQGILAVQAGTGTIVDLGLTTVATNTMRIDVNVYNSWGSWNSNPIMYNILMINDIYFSIRRTGTTLEFWVSTDGLTYNRFYSTTDPGVNRMGLIKFGSSLAVFDFFRYTNSYKDYFWVPPGRVVPIGGGGSSTNSTPSVVTTQGDLIVGGASGEETRLAKGTANQILQMDATGTNVGWNDPPVSGGLVTYVNNETNRSYTADATWENIAGTSLTFNASGNRTYLVLATVQYRVTTGNWDHVIHRLTIDGATANILPSSWDDTKSSSSDNSDVKIVTMQFVLINPSAGSHTIYLQTYDNGSSVDREYSGTFLSIL
jgi:hypothetical protein